MGYEFAPDHPIEPGKCLALVNTRAAIRERLNVEIPSEFLLAMGNAFEGEITPIMTDMTGALRLLKLARPVRIEIRAGSNEDAESIRRLFPPDVRSGPEFNELADALLVAEKALENMKKGPSQ